MDQTLHRSLKGKKEEVFEDELISIVLDAQTSGPDFRS